MSDRRRRDDKPKLTGQPASSRTDRLGSPSGATRRHRTATSSTRLRRELLAPTARQWTDLGLLTALCLLALFAFRTTYGGWEYFVVGGLGLVLGVLLGHLCAALRQPLIAVAAVAVLTFFLLGGAVALRQDATGGVLPSVSTLRGLSEITVHGWKDLLTTLPPVGNAGGLLTIPYLLGLLAGVLGASLCERTRNAFAPLIAPIGLLAAAILLGTTEPSSLLLQGAVFAALAMTWVALRSRRRRTTVRSGSGRQFRLLTATAMLLAAAGAGLAASPHLLGAATDRLVLRTYVVPPFDISQYPSPLAGFRKYAKNGVLHDQVLFRATGLPSGTPVRIATMDGYTGSVWAAANVASADGSTGTFQRIGSRVLTPIPGRKATVRVTLGDGYRDVWVPTAGQLSTVSFGRGDAAAESFRYNLATGSGVLPQGLGPGDEYTMKVVVPTEPTDRPSAFGEPTLTSDLFGFTRAAVNEWGGSDPDEWNQVQAVADHLRTVGRYSDGAGAQQQYLAGHGIGRLTSFLSAPQLVGDDEQYAAVFALMVNQVGMPARVVLGAVPEDDGTVKGSDVHAWVEVHLSSGRWLTIPTSRFMPDTSKAPDNQPPQTQQDAEGKVVPPPNSVKPPSSLENPQQPQQNVSRSLRNKDNILGIPVPHLLYSILFWAGPPILLILLVIGVILGVKRWRRSRRRRRGSPSTRLANAWRDVLDHARDLGTVVPTTETRPQQAGRLRLDGAAPLARVADAGVFGGRDPQPSEIEAAWRQGHVLRSALSHQVGRWRRFRAAVSLRSLRTRTG